MLCDSQCVIWEDVRHSDWCERCKMPTSHSYIRPTTRPRFDRIWIPMNKTISAAKEIFATVDNDKYLGTPSHERGLTHEPLSEVNAIPHLSFSPIL